MLALAVVLAICDECIAMFVCYVCRGNFLADFHSCIDHVKVVNVKLVFTFWPWDLFDSLFDLRFKR